MALLVPGIERKLALVVLGAAPSEPALSMTNAPFVLFGELFKVTPLARAGLPLMVLVATAPGGVVRNSITE